MIKEICDHICRPRDTGILFKCVSGVQPIHQTGSSIVPLLCLSREGVSVHGTALWPQQSTLSVNTSDTHSVAVYLHQQGIPVIPYLDDL